MQTATVTTMEELKFRFIGGQSINAEEFIQISANVGYKIPQNIATQIANKIDSVRIIYNNGASSISGYGLRYNTSVAIGRVIRDVYNQLNK